MKFSKWIFLFTLLLLLIQNIISISIALEKDMKYDPSSEYRRRISIVQEIRYCIEICMECFTYHKTDVLKVN